MEIFAEIPAICYTRNMYENKLPDGWVQAKYETSTHYLISYLMEPGSEFHRRWTSFCEKWEDAKGPEMRIKQEEARRQHQGFGDSKMREAVQRALKPTKSRASGTIDILRLDKILIAEQMAPLMSLDPRGFVAKTPGSKKEARYRAEGVPDHITDEHEALKYIYKNGPPITQTASTRARGNRDPRIKAWRCFSEWTRWLEVKALNNLLKNLAEDVGADVTAESADALMEIIRNG
jgi:hypothetical protein